MSLVEAAVPENGSLTKVADGIFWLRLPLPFRLNHVNVWVLEDGDGWAIIDCGVDDQPSREIWDSVLAGPLGGRPLRRVIATHGHTDHVGGVARLLGRNDASFESSLAEWMAARLRFVDHRDENSAALMRYLTIHGCSDSILESFRGERERVGTHLGAQPETLVRLRHGTPIFLAGRQWSVLTFGGHADEHVCLFDATNRVLIAGDQVLPHISPLVAVFPAMPDSNPLSEYLESLAGLMDLPDDTLVLPGHGVPFRGLHARLRSLQAHHASRLQELVSYLAAPLTAFDAMQLLFPRASQNGQGRLALGETLAHLNRLLATNTISRLTAPDGRTTFVAMPSR